MSEKTSIDLREVGEELEPLEVQVTQEFNDCYLDAVEDHNPRYMRETEFGPPVVHPALLFNWTNITRSPSYYERPGVVSIAASGEAEFLNPGRVGKTFRISWKIVDKYEKRGKLWMDREVLVVDEDGLEILRRRDSAVYPMTERREEK